MTGLEEAVGTYTFKIHMLTFGGVTQYLQNADSGDDFEIQVVCGQSSTSITIDAFNPFDPMAPDYSDMQFVNLGSANAKFVLPAITSSLPACGIVGSKPSLYVDSLDQTDIGLNTDAALNGAAYEVTPVDPNVHAEYPFYIQAEADGGAISYAGEYTLVVGCTDSLPIDQSIANVVS